jgi:subtilisin family serine protease
MSKIDPRLKFLQQESQEILAELESINRFAVEVTEVPSPRVKVLLRYTGNLAELEQRGFEVRTVAGDVISGVIELSRLEEISTLPELIGIESSRPMIKELDVSVPEIRANLVHTGPPGYRGNGVIVGIIDSGIDFTHECFRKADGTSRILAIWDQSLTPNASESHPPGYTYGVEYTKANIDTAISAANPFSVVRHRDAPTQAFHGTHVAGIAAGDGSVAGNGQPAFTFIGVAPEADIIVVANSTETEALGDSANTLDAVDYIFKKAATLGKAVVINLSQGDNLGSHDGTSLLERGIDNLLGGQGRAMVKSAGNEGDKGRHASGSVVASASITVQFVVDANDSSPNTIDIWYAGSDRFGISITPPVAGASTVVNPGTTTTLTLPNGNRIFIDSVLNDPNNHDNRIYIQQSRGTSPFIQQGTWAFTLSGTTVVNGRFDAWIERGSLSRTPEFIPPHRDDSRTISIPGTSREIISVASYITKGSGVGNISSFSSRGPTRDNRQKPEISAPGEWVMSALAEASGTDKYQLMAGTSMSAPHVTGVIALMLQRNKNLTQAQLRDCLVNNARSDAFTGAVPNHTWGYGKIDAKAAFDCAAPPKLKIVDDPTLKFADDPPTLKFRDDHPTLKFVDDPPTLKFRDDPKLKFADDPSTLKFRDDIATSPSLDIVKQPQLDKPPVTDGGKLPAVDKAPAGDLPGGGLPGNPVISRATEAAPFVLATPHHSMAWSQSYPDAYQATLAQYQTAIAQYEAALTQLRQAELQQQLSPSELQQAESLYQEYQSLLAEYQQLTQQTS